MTISNQNNEPLVSIVIPVYNGSNFMRDAIDSALNQTYKNIEILVINDGSNDKGKTDNIAKSYGNRIRYFNKPNGGVSSAINYGIKHMKGEYFSWLSHDDAYLPTKVEDEINYLKKHRLLHKKAIPYSDCQVIDRKGRAISNIIIDHNLANKHQEYAFLRCIMNGNSLLIPKSAWDKYGGLDTTLKCTQDYEKWYEMNQTYKFIHVPKVLVKSRYHSGQVTNTSPLVRTEGNILWLKVIKNYNAKKRKALNGSDYAFYYYFIEHLKNTPYDEALAYCKKEIKKYPIPVAPLPPEKLIKYNSLEKPFSKNLIRKVFQIIDREGLKNLFIRINKKLKNIIGKKSQ